MTAVTDRSVPGDRPLPSGGRGDVGTGRGPDGGRPRRAAPLDPAAAALALRWRLRDLAVCAMFAALCLNSSSGRLTPDTKLDLVADPGRFLARALHLWDAQGFAGQLQNQAYGYLFPMGPFFWACHSLGMPGWVAQRLWWTLLLSVAYLGVVRLAGALEVGTPLSRRIAGCAFACSPHVLTLFGANSVESLPMCVAPWVVLALVRGSQGGSTRRAGLLCGLAVLCMGGVNAAADLAALLPAVLWLLTRRPDRRTRRLAGWAVAGTLLATVWWVVPLLLLGRFSPPFLDYIENARTTTSVTSLTESLRGTADWVAYLPSSGWHAGYQLLTQPVLIADSVVLVAAGLAGLALTRSPHRPWLLACLGVGLVAVTLGHPGPVSSLFAGHERALLDTALAPIRNVHKFDVLLRLPLALGVAELVPRPSWGRTMRDRVRSRLVVRVVAVVAVIGAASPLVTLNLAADATFTALPGYWRQTATWLGAHAGDGRALLTPASSTPSYVWGTPNDEPLQALAVSPWEVRDNIPLTTPGHIRSLDALDGLLATGTAQPQLAAYAARSGLRYLVVRNDLDYRASHSTAPAVVQATLAASPGLTRVATFGPVVGQVGDYSYSVDQGLQPPEHAVEIWQVRADGDPRVTSAASLTRLSGGPESVLQLQQAGVDPGAATVLAGSTTGGLTPSGVVVTDGLRRREVNYGGSADQHSDTLTADDDGLIGRRVPDYLPVGGTAHQSVVRYLGARSITASSSAADADGFFQVVPGEQPWSAFDGDPVTVWRTAPGSAPVGQWIAVQLSHPRSVPSVTVRVSRQVTRLAVTTSTGTRTYAVRGGELTAPLPAGTTSSVRITIAAVTRGYGGQVAIGTVALAGVHLARTVVVPRDLPTDRPADVLSFATPGDARTGCLLFDDVPTCIAGRARSSEDGATIDRTVTLPQGASYQPTVTVAARAGSTLSALLSRTAGYRITATASSQAVPDPSAGPQRAVDGSGSTGWVAAPGDPDPTITLRLPSRVTLTHLTFLTTPTLAATRPDLLRITSPGGARSAVIGGDGEAHFAALTTDELVLHLGVAESLRPVVAPSFDEPNVLGLGVSEIVVPGVHPATPAATAARPVTLPCGSGPALHVDGRTLQTRVSTDVGTLRDLQAVPATVCGDSQVDLGAGTHRLVVSGSALWAAQSLVLTRAGARTATAGAGPSVRVRSWGDTHRTVDVAARTSPAVLVVDENANAGWRAELHGVRLRTVTVDGWRQGYVLPAGARGTVSLTFGPQRTYVAALLVGLGGVLLLLVLLAVPLVRRRRRARTRLAAARGWAVPRPVTLAVGIVVCTLIGGPTGALVAVLTGAAVLATERWFVPALARRSGAPVGATVGATTGNPAGDPAEDPSTGPAPSDRAGVVPAVLAAAALGVAGAVLTVQHFGSVDYAADTTPMQVLCLIAVAAVATAGGRR